MSRGDFWSIAATLIVAGVGYFVGGKWTAYGCIGLGGLIILYLLFTHQEKEASPATQTATQTANPQMTANPHLSQNISLHLPGPEKQEKTIPPPAKPKPQHNLKLQSCRMARVEENLGPHGEMNGFHFPEDQAKPNAAIVCIKNKSKDGEVAYIEDVRAALIFKDKHGREIGDGVHQACWVNNYLQNASFDLEETKCVILVMIERGPLVGQETVVSPYIRETMGSHGRGARVDAYPLDTDAEVVELILLSGSKRVMEPMTFELTVENSKPGIRLASDDEE
jgi:hypothetical protein